MTISKELKLGVIAIGTVLMMIWGYSFLKGQKLFATSVTLYSTFDDVYQLAVSSPVYINGLKVGNVTAITVNPENVKEMEVAFMIEGEYGIPKTAMTKMISEGLVGGRALAIEYDHMCKGDCVTTGDILPGRIEGLLESMVPKGEISTYVDELTSALGSSMSDSTTMVNDLSNNLTTTIKNLADITESLDVLLRQSSKNLTSTLRNVDQLSGSLASNDQKITNILSNLEQLTQDLNKADIATVGSNANKAILSADQAITAFEATAKESNAAIAKLNELVTEIKSGDGSMAQLVNDPSLYTNLEETSANLSLLLQDLRLNPKRYVNVSVFGKKSKAYVVPADDPAMDQK